MKPNVFIHPLSILLSATAALSLPAETSVTTSGTEVVYDISAGETYTLAETFPAGTTTVTKKGAGTLAVTVSNADFKGLTVDIQAGKIIASQLSPFGSGETTKVAAGAALWYTGPRKDNNLYNAIFGTVEIDGDGPDHLGAFCRAGDYYGTDEIIATLKVMGGATVGGTKRYGIRRIELNGHTLTNALTGGTDNPFMFRDFGSWYWYHPKMVGPGNMVQASDKVILQGVTAANWDGIVPSTCSWTMTKASSTLDLNADGTVFPWTLKAGAAVNVQLPNGTVTIGGPVTNSASGASVTFKKPSASTKAHVLNLSGGLTVNATFNDPALTVNVADAPVLVSSLSLGGASFNVTGGGSHRLGSSWYIPSLGFGSSLSYQDAGEILADGILNCGNANFATDRLISTLDLAGQTCFRSTKTSYPQPTLHIGSYWKDDSVGSTSGGWGALTVRDGAVLTNGLAVGISCETVPGAGAVYVRGASVMTRARSTVLGAAGGYAALCGTNATLVTSAEILLGSGTGTEAHAVLFGGTACNNQTAFKMGGAYANLYLGAGAQFDMNKTYSDPNNASVFHFSHANDAAESGESVLTCDGGSTCIVSRVYTAAKTNRTTQINLNNGGYFTGYQIWYSSDHSRAANTTYRWSFNGGVFDYSRTWETASVFADAPDRMVVHSGGATIGVAANSSLQSYGAFVRPSGKSVKAITPPTDADYLAATNIGPARIVFEGAGEGMTAFIAFDDRRKCLGNVVITSPGEGCDGTTRAYAVIPQYPNRQFECALELDEESGGDLVKFGSGQLLLDSTNTYAGATVVRGGTLTAGCDWAIPSNTTVRLESGNLYLNYKRARLKSLEGSGGSISGISGNVLTVDHLSTFGLNGATFPSGDQLFVAGAWTIDADELIANKKSGKVPNYAANVRFQTGSTIAFTNVAKLDPNLSPYPICAFAGGSRTGLPQLVGDPLPDRWKFKVVDGVFSLVRGKGFMVIVR